MNLELFFNHRRQWTSQLKFGNVFHPTHNNIQPNYPPHRLVPNKHLSDSTSTSHASHNPRYLDTNTPLQPPPPNINIRSNHNASTQTDNEHAILNSSINSLHLHYLPIPPTPPNSPIAKPYPYYQSKLGATCMSLKNLLYEAILVFTKSHGIEMDMG